jgi:putative heme-binding domain-containing protein
VLERLGQLDDETLAAAFADSTSAVRTHTVRSLAERERLTPEQREIAWRGLRDPSAFVQRAALEVLGRHPAADNLLRLLEHRKNLATQDTQMIHTARMTLRDQFRSDEVLASIKLATFDDQSSQSIADVMPGVPAPPAAEWLLRYARGRPDDLGNFSRGMTHIARHLPGERLPEFFAFARESCADDLRKQAATILVLHEGLQSRGVKLPDDVVRWAVACGRELIEKNEVDGAREAIRLARAMKLEPLGEPISGIAAGRNPYESLRADAISMLAEVHPERSLAFLSAILGNAGEPMPLRQHVAGTLGQRQRPEFHAELIRHLRAASEELGVHIAAALSGGRAGAEKLLEEIATGKASARLLQHPLVNGRLRAARLPNIDDRIGKLTEGLPPAEERLQQAIQSRRAGYAKATPDAERGAKVFEKHCANCHTLANKGAKVGPQLDGIGVRGLDRILEDVLDPNRNVDQAFRSSIVALKNGQVLTGLVLNSDGEVLVLADAQGKEVRVPKSDIEDRTTSKLSPMPANVSELIPVTEFYDLVAYMLSIRSARDDEKGR